MLRHQPRRETLRSWLITVAKREAVRLELAARRIEPMSIGEPVIGEVPEPPARVDVIEQVLSLDEALAVVAELPERKARLYALQALGFTYEEIGRMTGDSFHTVDRQLTRARDLLRINAQRRRAS
jgi:DNA-directed RNA polymerase specialized sigma24 family protein